jgi:hypothetical protein
VGLNANAAILALSISVTLIYPFIWQDPYAKYSENHTPHGCSTGVVPGYRTRAGGQHVVSVQRIIYFRGSSSASIGKSSDSSNSGAKDKVAQGQYTVVDVAEVADQTHMLRVRLQPRATEGAVSTGPSFDLVLPRQAAEQGHLVAGQTIAAEHRPYGLAFAAVTETGNASPFFLVLDDDWYRELQSRPVVI